MLEYFKTNKNLRARIQDLEKTVEIITGSNNILERELSEIKVEKSQLLEKLFDLTGINRRTQLVQTQPQMPVRIGNKGVPWSKVRETLEAQATREYWERKKAEKEKSDSKIEELEDERTG